MTNTAKAKGWLEDAFDRRHLPFHRGNFSLDAVTVVRLEDESCILHELVSCLFISSATQQEKKRKFIPDKPLSVYWNKLVAKNKLFFTLSFSELLFVTPVLGMLMRVDSFRSRLRRAVDQHGSDLFTAGWWSTGRCQHVYPDNLTAWHIFGTQWEPVLSSVNILQKHNIGSDL